MYNDVMTSAQVGLQLRDVARERFAEARRLSRKLHTDSGIRVQSVTALRRGR